jgi:hypothetical protein
MAHMVGLIFKLSAYQRRDEETKAYVVYCPSLDLYTAAQTREEVLPSMMNGAEMFIRVCYDRGILEQVLQKRGFQTNAGAAKPPGNGDGDFISVQEAVGDFEESFPFEVPMPLVSQLLASDGSAGGTA